MKGRHTPGPWDANKFGTGLITQGEHGLHIARVDQMGMGYSAEANAHLIAAEEVLDLFEKFNSHGMVFCRADMAGLVAAVAKAKGE